MTTTTFKHPCFVRVENETERKNLRKATMEEIIEKFKTTEK